MKKILARTLTILAGMSALIPSTLAQDCNNPSTLSHEEKVNCLIPSQQDLIEGSARNEGTTLATGDIGTDIIPFFINMGLAIAGTLIFISFLYAGFLLVFANDTEENIEKGKKIMIYAVVGAVIMAISYAIIYGVANLQIN